MYLIFEYLFYVGCLALAIGTIWLIYRVARKNWKQLWLPIVFLLIGLAALSAPAIYTRYLSTIDLGPRKAFVDNEKHLTLTGWNGANYDLLKLHPDTTVLQMSNADVTDGTIDLLSDMSRLRELDLNDTAITDAGLAKLAALESLETVRLRATKISDSGFRSHIMQMPKLKRLDLRETAVSADLVEEWKQAREGRRAFR